MIRKSALKNIRYNPKYIAAEDYKLWVDLAKNGVQFANLQEPLLKYNFHEKNIGKTHFEIQQKNTKKIKKEFIAFYLNGNNEDFKILFYYLMFKLRLRHKIKGLLQNLW